MVETYTKKEHISRNLNLDHINSKILKLNKKYIIYEFLYILLKYITNITIYDLGNKFAISLEFVSENELKVIFFDKNKSFNLYYTKRCIVDDIEEQGLNEHIQIEQEVIYPGLYSYSACAYIQRYFELKNSRNNIWAIFEGIRLRLSKEVNDILYNSDILMIL